jgi:hypothetical protein
MAILVTEIPIPVMVAAKATATAADMVATIEDTQVVAPSMETTTSAHHHLLPHHLLLRQLPADHVVARAMDP